MGSGLFLPIFPSSIIIGSLALATCSAIAALEKKSSHFGTYIILWHKLHAFPLLHWKEQTQSHCTIIFQFLCQNSKQWLWWKKYSNVALWHLMNSAIHYTEKKNGIIENKCYHFDSSDMTDVLSLTLLIMMNQITHLFHKAISFDNTFCSSKINTAMHSTTKSGDVWYWVSEQPVFMKICLSSTVCSDGQSSEGRSTSMC